VGLYGDGKKEFNKHITIAIDKSLHKVTPGSPAWGHFSRAAVFVADESHLCPASTLAEICLGLMKDAPYRFFFSGTQTRNDGQELLLNAITGPIVFRMSVKEGVDQGYLSRPRFTMFEISSDSKKFSDDANKETRTHLYYNQKVVRAAADLANKAVGLLGRPTVILIEELEQFAYLEPLLKYEAKFAHGGVTKENRDVLPPAYHKSNPTELVDRFNAGEFPILVGTSCISLGTDLTAVGCLVYLQGKSSEIKIKQAVGRGTRLHSGKIDCLVFDFDVVNVKSTHRHAKVRRAIYNDIYGPVQTIKL
jgi:superfamily II DNA or RNA helicase